MRHSGSLRAAICAGAALALAVRCGCCLAAMLPAEFVQPPSMFAANTASTRYCGPDVVRLASGKLVIHNWGFESTDGGRSWTPNNGVVGGPNGIIHLSDGRWAAVGGRPSRLGQGGSMPTIQFSPELGANAWNPTWSAPVVLPPQEDIYYVPNQRLIETNRGSLVVAVARGGGKYEGDNNSAGCFYSTDRGKTWSMTETWAKLSGQRGMQEPNIAELDDGRLVMLARTGKGYHYKSYSSDGGKTWSAPQRTTLRAACSPLTMRRMPDGRLFVVYEHGAPLGPESLFPRNPLVWAISSDGGTTWGSPRLIDATPGRELFYPSITFLNDGILITYGSSYADASGNVPSDAPIIGGAMSCILAYPASGPGELAMHCAAPARADDRLTLGGNGDDRCVTTNMNQK